TPATLAGTTCTEGVNLLSPHPTNPNRLFLAYGCGQGFSISVGHALIDSPDRGDTGTSRYRRAGIFPSALVGGTGADPLRWYMAGVVPIYHGGSLLLRSDDDTQSWEEVGDDLWDLGLQPSLRPWISALQIVPAALDTVYVAHAGK